MLAYPERLAGVLHGLLQGHLATAHQPIGIGAKDVQLGQGGHLSPGIAIAGHHAGDRRESGIQRLDGSADASRVAPHGMGAKGVIVFAAQRGPQIAAKLIAKGPLAMLTKARLSRRLVHKEALKAGVPAASRNLAKALR